MRTAVIMPRLGESVTEGTVVRWRKQVGDHVEAGEPLLEVSTDKVDTEVVSPATGTLLEINVLAETTVEIGVELGAVGEAREATTAAPATSRPRATPVVRKLAREHGVDLAVVVGSGERGRIRQSDVLAVARAQPAATAPPPVALAPVAPAITTVAGPPRVAGRTEPMSRTRQVIAARLVESLQTAAQLTTVVEVDLTRVAQLRERAKKDFLAREGVKLSFLPFFARAAIEALKAHPIVNASLDGGAKTITHPATQNLGIAVDTDRGLLVPVIRDAGDLNLAGLARKIADLAARARAATIGADELGGGTFTLTNTGSRGALFDTPIVHQPQSAILGTGAVVKRAVVVTDPALGDVIVPRSMAFLALSYDHRIIDGADAARFLVTIKERLEIGSFKDELRLL